MKQVLRGSAALAFAVGLTLVGQTAFAAGVTPIKGYDFNTTGATVAQAGVGVADSSLWAQQQYKNSTTDVFFSYKFQNIVLTNHQHAIDNTAPNSFGDTHFTGNTTGWSTSFFGSPSINTGAAVTDEILPGPGLNGQPADVGGKFLFLQPSGGTGTVTLVFGKAAQSAGFMISGLGNLGGSVNVTTNTGDTYTIKGSNDPTVAGHHTASLNGGLAYYAFNAAHPFTSLTFSAAASSDKWSINEINYTLVPEPAEIVSFIAAALLLGGLMLRKRSRGMSTELMAPQAIG